MNISELKKQYRQNGFVIVNDAISAPMIAYLRKTATDLLLPALKKEGIKAKDPLHDGLIALDKIDHGYVSRFFDAFKDTDALYKVVFNEKVTTLAKEFIGIPQESGLYVPYHISRVDPPADGRFLYKWHQESYYSMFGADQVQVWAPLIEPTTRQNGAMTILIGSSRDGEIQHRIERNLNGIQQKCIGDDEVTGKYEEFHAELKLGQMVFFHPYAVHRSNDNNSNQVRYSLVAAYSNINDPKFYFGTQAEMSDYHAKRCSNYAMAASI